MNLILTTLSIQGWNEKSKEVTNELTKYKYKQKRENVIKKYITLYTVSLQWRI